MAGDQEQQPPESITLSLEQALELLSVLEEASVTLIETERYAGVADVDAQIRVLTGKLGFDDGGFDDD